MMNVNSAFNAGVEGFQRASEQATNAAASIASATAYNRENDNTRLEPASNNQASEQTRASGVNSDNLTRSLVDLKVSEYQAKSSAEVIRTADESLGTLLDVRV